MAIIGGIPHFQTYPFTTLPTQKSDPISPFRAAAMAMPASELAVRRTDLCLAALYQREAATSSPAPGMTLTPRPQGPWRSPRFPPAKHGRNQVKMRIQL